MNPWLILTLAIITETIATSALKSSQEFTRLIPSMIVIIGYGLSFYLLTLTLKSLPIGTVYAIWSGAGIALITLIGWLAFKEKPDAPMLLGIGLIILGILTIHLFSKSHT
ncbi:multidrug efflux SMR transporter [Thiomicrorhabdus sp.]|uniref:DMT family transporter n=1 Tax=Thiomicrorhabdus sp. TaxID=2039724 RepID=UPI0029C83980|nr:multidrug efflux SMR transporter [Thiomicrorhabdus sp.]